MKEFLKAIDELPDIVKLILCIPVLDIIWNIYRLVKSLDANNSTGIILSVVMLIVGIPFMWVVDLVCMLMYKKIWWIC